MENDKIGKVITLAEIEQLKDAAFALETIAHLQGLERILLPTAKALRDIVAKIS